MGYDWLPLALDRLRNTIEPYEVLQALNNPRRLPQPLHTTGVKLLIIYTRTTNGRPLAITVWLGGPFNQTIIDVRDMTAHEADLYAAWETQ